MKKGLLIGLGVLLLSLAACATDAEIEAARKARKPITDAGDTSPGSLNYAVGMSGSR